MSPSARRYRSCRKKVTHLTRKEAWKHARRIGNGNKPYQCSYCGHHHVGHPTSDPILRGLKRQRAGRRFSGRRGRFQRAA